MSALRGQHRIRGQPRVTNRRLPTTSSARRGQSGQSGQRSVSLLASGFTTRCFGGSSGLSGSSSGSLGARCIPSSTRRAEAAVLESRMRTPPNRGTIINGGLSFDNTLCNLCRRPACGSRASVRRHPTSSGNCNSACPPAAKLQRPGFASCQPRMECQKSA